MRHRRDEAAREAAAGGDLFGLDAPRTPAPKIPASWRRDLPSTLGPVEGWERPITVGQPGVLSNYVKMKNPLVVDAQGKNWNQIPFGPQNAPHHTRHIVEFAKEAGHDGVIVRNVIDRGVTRPGQKRLPQDVIVSLDPKNVRSVTEGAAKEVAEEGLKPVDKLGLPLDGKQRGVAGTWETYEGEELYRLDLGDRSVFVDSRDLDKVTTVIPADETGAPVGVEGAPGLAMFANFYRGQE